MATRAAFALRGTPRALTDEEAARRAALQAELDAIEAQYADADEFPDEVDARCGEIEAALDALDNRPLEYDAADIARAGAFVTIDADGALDVRRGYVRPEDEPAATQGEDDQVVSAPDATGTGGDPFGSRVVVIPVGGEPPADEEEADDALRPLSDRLVTELTAHRTLALRDAVARSPGVALLAVLHALCLGAFYHGPSGSCLEISARSATLSHQAPGLADSASARAIEARHEQWRQRLPKAEPDLWGALQALPDDERAALLAHVASLSVNALVESTNRRPAAIAHSHVLAGAAGLDMVTAGWEAVKLSGRVPRPASSKRCVKDVTRPRRNS